MEPRKPNPEPDLEEDPRRKGVGEQMPEEQPEEVSGDGTRRGPAADTGGSDAADVGVDEEGGPEQATGNPRSAGGRQR
jgi:hypothetical protein